MTVQEKLIAIYEQAEKRLKEIIVHKGAFSSAAVYQRSLLRQIEDELRRLRRKSAAVTKQLVEENYRIGLEELIGELKTAGVTVETDVPKAEYSKTPEVHSDPPESLSENTAANAAAQLAMSGLNKRQIETVARNAATDLERAVNLVSKRVKDFIREETETRPFNVPNLIGRREQDIIRTDTLDAAAEKLSTGQTVRQMQKRLKERLEAENITAVPYKNGIRMPMKKYAEMAARSTTAEAQNTAKTTQGAEWGYEFVRMTSHSPTCAVCAQYQGRVYALTREAAEGKYKLKDGTVLRFPYLYDTAFASGYQTIHPNCRHRIAVIPMQAYTNEQLKKFSADSTKPFEDTRSDQERKAYAADQARKRKQNEMRKQYERIKAALPDQAPKSFAGFVRMKATNSQRYQELMQDYRYIQKQAKNSEKAVEKPAESGIIKGKNNIFPTGNSNDNKPTKKNQEVFEEPKTFSSIEDVLGKKKTQPYSIEDAAKNANADYGKNGYDINCQRCIQTYELRRRGYDVTAKEKDGILDPISFGHECFQSSDGEYVAFEMNKTKRAVQRELQNAPNNSRFGIYLQWKSGNGSHVFIAEKTDDGVRYIDPQNGNTDVSDYMKKGKYFHFGLFRFDDKEITDDLELLDYTVRRV